MAMATDEQAPHSLDELPLPALSVIVAHCGSRPDPLLRCCKSLWRLRDDPSTWAQWMIATCGASEALHKLRRCVTRLQAAPSRSNNNPCNNNSNNINSSTTVLNTSQDNPSSVVSEEQEEEERRVLAAVRLLLAAGADPNLTEEKTGFWAPSALWWAVCKGYAAVASALTKAGAAVDENVMCAAAAQVRNAHAWDRLGRNVRAWDGAWSGMGWEEPKPAPAGTGQQKLPLRTPPPSPSLSPRSTNGHALAHCML